VRVSGSGVDRVVQGITGRTLEPRKATLSLFRDAQGAAIDEGIALYFPSAGSYTGEDVVELQGHGGPVVMRLLLQRCVELGARIAEPGEFTRRAYLNGKLDLAQAEGVVDLIDASTAQAARAALRSLQGEFSEKIQSLMVGIIELRARTEAALDFPEEEVDCLERAMADQSLARVRDALANVLQAASSGSLLREGLHIAIAGAPNVGKSSLLNRLAGADLAIVTEIPGTRDPVRETIAVGGVPLHIIDTAGLRDTQDPVERIGVERAWTAIEKADAVLLVDDASALAGEPPAQSVVNRMPRGVPRLHVMNKIDLVQRQAGIERSREETMVWLSAKTGAGVELLQQAILELAGWERPPETAYLARERHLAALRSAEGHLAAAARHSRRLELFAEELRAAQEQLSLIVGEFTADDLLGEIFSRFCIGK
jgi:tRNA modification GTPase